MPSLPPPRQAQILAGLKARARYDSASEVSYVFDKLPTDPETLAVAARNNIFFAEPGKLLVMATKSQLTRLRAM